MRDEGLQDAGLEAEAQQGPARDEPAFWESMLGGSSSARWLLQDPEVDAAIRNERFHTLHRLLRKRIPAAPSAPARQALRALVANRRVFLMGVGKAPGLSTLNGIGARCYGEQETNPADGTYITTVFFTLLFIPVWPMAQYLVTRLSRSKWQFYGRVPLSGFHRGWRRLVGALAAIGVLSLAFNTYRSATQSDVRFMNGLDLPVEVAVDDEELHLRPGQTIVRVMSSGSYRIVTRRPGGEVIEEQDVEVPGGADVVVYNVMGAAPLVWEVIPYTAPGVDPSLGDASGRAESLAGDSWVVREDVDIVFRKTPKRIRIRKGESVTTRTRVSVWPGGWKRAVSHLAMDGRLDEGAALARRVSLLTPTDGEGVLLAYGYSATSGDVTATGAYIQEVLRAAPECIAAHRVYQDHMEGLGRLAETLSRYEAAWKAEPDSARHGYLYARVAPFATGLPILERLVPMYPEDTWLRRALGWIYFQSGRFAEALPHYRRLVEVLPEQMGTFADYLVRALVAEGHHEEAISLLNSIFDTASERHARGEDPLAGGSGWHLIQLYARLVRRRPASAAASSIEQRWKQLLDGEDPRPELLARTAAGARDVAAMSTYLSMTTDPATKQYCDLTVLSQREVGAAANMALTSDVAILCELDDEVLLSLACELERLGHRERATLLLEGLMPQNAVHVGMEQIEALPSVEGLSEDLNVDLRAVLLCAASRRVEDTAIAEDLLARARHLDVLRVVVPE